MGFRDAVASAGPYANNLHLAPERYPHQHLIIQFLQAGCFAFPFTTHIFTISADKWIPCLKDNGAQQHNWQRSSSSFLRPMSLHRESKKQDTKLSPITSPNVNRFSKNSFANEMKDKFARK